jgi:hypothetical protein
MIFSLRMIDVFLPPRLLTSDLWLLAARECKTISALHPPQSTLRRATEDGCCYRGQACFQLSALCPRFPCETALLH